MKTIAIVNLKGGVGKTATAINMAAILALDYKQRVLLIDADSQCNTTEFLGGEPAHGNLADVLRFHAYSTVDRVTYAVGSIQHTRFKDIDLLCGADSLMDLDLSQVKLGGVQSTVLLDMVKQLKAIDAYDWCLVDCPPAFNAASAAALVASDEVIIPIKLDAFALRGMVNLMRQVYNMQRINPRLQVAGILPTMWYKSDTIAKAEKALRESGLRMYPPIRRTDKVDEMTFAQEPLPLCSPRSAAGVDYRRFVRDLVHGGANNG